MRPGPLPSPTASAPSSGGNTWYPMARSACDVLLHCACAHMRSFMAGTISTGDVVASRHADSRSSACPPAARARKSAVAGATTTRSAARGQRDVVERVPGRDERRVHGPPGQRLERDLADELTRRAREHDVDLGAGLREQPREPRRLVGRDAAGDPEENALTIEGTHEGRG